MDTLQQRGAMRALTAPLALLVLSLGCSEDFDPYNELLNFRVLAVRAEKPTIAFGEAARLDALTYNPDDSPVSWSWSWCPATEGASRGYACAFSRESLQENIDARFGAGIVTVPPYELSTTSSATFSYDLPPALFEGVCAAVSQADLPAFVERPKCDGTFEITIKLVARAGDRQVTAVKGLNLIYGDRAPLNTNPTIMGVRIRDQADPETALEPLDPTTTATLARDHAYTLELQVPESTAETFTSVSSDGTTKRLRESLLFTWFVEGGEMDSARTSFIEGEVPMERATRNIFKTPRKADYPRRRLRLAFVVIDGRGGVAWTERTIALAD